MMFTSSEDLAKKAGSVAARVFAGDSKSRVFAGEITVSIGSVFSVSRNERYYLALGLKESRERFRS